MNGHKHTYTHTHHNTLNPLNIIFVKMFDQGLL